MTDDRKSRHWTLRINSNNDGGGYLYSGDDVSYPKDDYLKVIELKPTLQLMKEMGDALDEVRFHEQKYVDASNETTTYYLNVTKKALEKYRKFLEGIEK